MKNKRDEKDCTLTTDNGIPISNDTSSLTVGEDGPVLLKDTNLIEKLASFDRERIPERVVHAKGSAAYGYFEVTNSMRKYTIAKVFTEENKRVPVLVRFSTVIGSEGSADTARDPRGFAVKFYTDEGNYDIVGNNLPVFFIRDALKFPDMIHAFKPAPDTGVTDLNRFWDFISVNPESTNMITYVYSDLGTIKSFRKMEGFGVNTYVWVCPMGKRRLIKYHWKPLLGVETIDRDKAIMLAGINPDIARQDLYECLARGEKVRYDWYVQILELDDIDKLNFDVYDATKIWPEDKIPLIKVGTMTLDKNPDNFFVETNQAAFAPSNLVPGIEASNDKLLQGRLFAYRDTQRHRLGPNFNQLPVNAPKVKVCNYHQNGNMRYRGNPGHVNYRPNMLDNNKPNLAKDIASQHICLNGEEVRKVIEKADDFTQAGERYRSLSKKEREHLIYNILCDLKEVNREIQERLIANFTKADKDFGECIKKGLKIKD